MKKQLHVPSPPAYPPRSAPRSVDAHRGRATARPRFSCSRTALLAALAAAVGLLFAWLCLLVVGLPILLAGGDDQRVNVLLLGLDRREGSDWAHRTDTVMVVSVDPGSGAAGMLSIPRDLQVPIPGQGEDRINTANVYGYLNGYPGGGPALAVDTVESNFGISLDGYAMLDFNAFERIVDALGGIEVHVSETLHDTQYPDPRPEDPHAFKTVHFDPGPQRLDGQRALEYARSRMSTSDFDRARRQQEVVLAIRKKALSPGGILRLPLVAAIVLGSVQTDLSPAEVMSLGLLAVRLNPERVERVVLEAPLVYDYERWDGAAVQLPNWELINPVVQAMFGPH